MKAINMNTLKKKRNMLLVFLTAALLALGITGGAIFAQEAGADDDGAHNDSTKKGMASRVAAILGLGEQEVEDAFKQAGREMRDERFENRMDRLVDKGQLTEDEAVEAVDWYQSRPEDIGPGRRGFGMKGRGHQRFGSGFGGFAMRGAGGFAHDGS